MNPRTEGGVTALMLDVSAHAIVTDRKLEEAAHALGVTGLSDLARQLGKARELHRLFAGRLTVILRALSESEAR